ncbi:unnamed protein product [Moneuplotes crassus]|uniref:Uncharacterized protein n=1 Tax=Euplotes crassus TaxID=5936 RepID=A0AAD1Y1E3_EUPCR|nr:unnamed protein product [Moneuplotes crassus]
MEEIKVQSFTNKGRTDLLRNSHQNIRSDRYFAARQMNGKTTTVHKKKACRSKRKKAKTMTLRQSFEGIPEEDESLENDQEQNCAHFKKTKRKGKCSRRCNALSQLLGRWLTCRWTGSSQKVRVRKYEPRNLNDGNNQLDGFAEVNPQNGDDKTYINQSSLALIERSHDDDLEKNENGLFELPEIQGAQGKTMDKDNLSLHLKLRSDLNKNSPTQVKIGNIQRKKSNSSVPKVNDPMSDYEKLRNEITNGPSNLPAASFFESEDTKIAKGGHSKQFDSKNTDEWSSMEEGEEFTDVPKIPDSRDSTIGVGIKSLFWRQLSPDEPLQLFSQSFRDIIGRTVTTGVLMTNHIPIIAENQCEILYEDKRFKAKPRFNFKKVRLYIGLSKQHRVKKNAVSNIKFDEDCISAKAGVYKMAQKKGTKIWSPNEDQILLENLDKSNYTAISFKINEYNKIDTSKLTSLKDTGPLGAKSSEDCRRRADLLKKTRKIGQFTKEEDDKILLGYQTFHNKWSLIAKRYLPGRNGKQVRERYLNYLSKVSMKKAVSQNVQKPPFTNHQDALLMQKVKSESQRWADILKDDFEDRTKIELKQRYKELESVNNQYIGVEENEELEKIIDEVNFMARQEEMERNSSDEQMMFSMKA